MADPAPAAEPLLQVGAHITKVSHIDLMDDQFSIELLLWTIWHGETDQNPSDQLPSMLFTTEISSASSGLDGT